jgi:DNA-binding transcriptional LysR family regulator
MLEGIQALVAIEKLGTVSQAATQLRLTQSAVSKRIQALESEIGYKLLQKDGRHVRLTPAALLFLSKAKSILVEVENLKNLGKENAPREFSIGIADSIASSWGPAVLRKSLQKVENLKLEIHVHRSTLIIENLKLGRYSLGIVTGLPTGKDLIWTPFMKEELVLAGQGPQGTSTKNLTTPIITIEPESATWREIGPLVHKNLQINGRRIIPVESFFAAAQMAKEGFGQCLIPLGVAHAVGLKPTQFNSLSPKIERQIHLIARKSVYQSTTVQEFIQFLEGVRI